MQIPWTGLDHVTILLALGAPLFWAIQKIREMVKQNVEYHRKFDLMWQELYGDWDGKERRKFERKPNDSW